jgi:tripartite-type tricarboxylate transporter receptor subunit TctC
VTAPDVRTFSQQGVSNFDLVAWFLRYAPAETPLPALAHLRNAAARTLGNPDIIAKFGTQRLELRYFKAEELLGFGRAETTKWADLVKRSGAQVDSLFEKPFSIKPEEMTR